MLSQQIFYPFLILALKNIPLRNLFVLLGLPSPSALLRVSGKLSLLVIHKYIAFSFMIHSSWFMRACLVYIKIIPQQIFIAEFRELLKRQKISVSWQKKYFTSWWQPVVFHEKLQAFCTWWKLCRHFEFCEVMFGLRKKNLKEKSFLWCLRKLVRLCAEDVGHT